MKDLTFITHRKETVSGKRLFDALNEVAQDWVDMAKAIRKENLYASHVTEEIKNFNLLKDLEYAEDIRAGKNINNFTIWQRVNNVLTGEYIGFLSK
jgi:hypothetical protein